MTVIVVCSMSYAIANLNAEAFFFSCLLGVSYLTGPIGAAASDTKSFIEICRTHFDRADSISTDILHHLQEVAGYERESSVGDQGWGKISFPDPLVQSLLRLKMALIVVCSTSHAIANPNAQASFFSCPLGVSYLTGPMGAASDTTSLVNICREHFLNQARAMAITTEYLYNQSSTLSPSLLHLTQDEGTRFLR